MHEYDAGTNILLGILTFCGESEGICFAETYQILSYCMHLQLSQMQSNQNQPGTVSPTANISYFQSFLIHNHPQTFAHILSSEEELEDNHLKYFNWLFSPKETAQSLERRNETFQMINFENSDSQPDEIYQKRKEKVSKLHQKEQNQLQQLEQIKKKDYSRYKSIIQFMKFFYEVKIKVEGIRTDYYSTKTFCALKNSSEEDILAVTFVSKRMFQNIMKQSRYVICEDDSSHNNGVDGRVLQFLIMPRFLISKEKIGRFGRDEQLQENFEFLIQHQCLGHYNNQANKKMPEETQMKFIRDLLKKSKGREKFKRICSINHGNKFLKNQKHLYYELYSKSLDYLKHLDGQLKRGKKYNTVKQELNRFPETQQTQEQSDSLSQSSSSNWLSFRSMGQVLNLVEGEMEIQDEEMDKKYKKIRSTPLQFEENKPTGFKVRKSLTLEQKKNQNILLVEPPKEANKQI